jgi:predicted Fe-Mo cluster-binding NifX family protein
MKIAVATVGTDVAAHFGHCERFTIFEVIDGQVVEEKSLPNPGHEPGLLPRLLAEEGVDVVIAGGMGARAQQLFAQKGIRPIIGAAGNVRQVVQDFLKGNLTTGPNLCEH